MSLHLHHQVADTHASELLAHMPKGRAGDCPVQPNQLTQANLLIPRIHATNARNASKPAAHKSLKPKSLPWTVSTQRVCIWRERSRYIRTHDVTTYVRVWHITSYSHTSGSMVVYQRISCHTQKYSIGILYIFWDI